jgi:hypothetical protein
MLKLGVTANGDAFTSRPLWGARSTDCGCIQKENADAEIPD